MRDSRLAKAAYWIFRGVLLFLGDGLLTSTLARLIFRDCLVGLSASLSSLVQLTCICPVVSQITNFGLMLRLSASAAVG